MNFKKTFLLSVCLLLSSAIASAQLLYKIEGNGAQPSYLFGTHHLAPFSFFQQYDLENLLDSVQTLVCEVDLGKQRSQEAITELQQYMTAPSDSTLTAVLSPDELSKVTDILKKHLPIPSDGLARFDIFKPAVIQTLLSALMISDMIEGYDPKYQIDGYLVADAKEKGKEIVEFETPEYQGALLYGSVPISLQAEELIRFCENLDTATENAKILNEAYQKGDLDTLMALAQEEPDTNFMDKLLDQRNQQWIKKLSQLLPEGPALIAVGALHLPGNQGLIEGLRNLGYNVTPVR